MGGGLKPAGSTGRAPGEGVGVKPLKKRGLKRSPQKMNSF